MGKPAGPAPAGQLSEVRVESVLGFSNDFAIEFPGERFLLKRKGTSLRSPRPVNGVRT